MPPAEISEPPAPTLSKGLSNPYYVRQRVQPRFRDLNYLILKDLSELLSRLAAATQGEVFDYGCGGAPYRPLFTHCKRYIAADIQPAPTVDRVLLADGTTGEPSGSYDAVLSTQVLEHIAQPAEYLAECHRILRPGGQLLLTTHGMFEEHGCPFDFQRWTNGGLELLASSSGFRVIESGKFTTELRAFVQLLNQMILHLRSPEKPWLHRLLAIPRKAYCVAGVPLLNWAAEIFDHQAIVPASHPSSLYIGVYVRAIKS